MRRSLFVGAVLSLVSLSAQAQQEATPSLPDPLETAQQDPGYFDVMGAFEPWNEEHGGHWRLNFNARTQAASFVFGGATPGSFVPRTDAEYFILARDFLNDTYGMHRVDPATLREASVVYLPLGNAGSTDKMTVRFEQHVRGVPVIGGSVNVLFNTQGHLLAIDVGALPQLAGFEVSAAYGEAEARNAAVQQFTQDVGVTPNVLERGALKVLMNREGKLTTPRLVWEVNAQFIQTDFKEEGWHYRFDAVSGELLDRQASVHSFDVSGTVTSKVTPPVDPDSGSNSITSAMPYITVTSSQGNAVADVNGNFNIVGATAPLQVTMQYDGTYALTNDNSGAEYTLTTTLNSSSGNTVLMNPTAPQGDTAEANAFNWIGLMRDWTVTVNPSDTILEFQALANVNQSSTCNASWTGNAINMFAAGGGCVNTSYSSVVLHEMGHWLNSLYGSGNGSDGFGEGNSDVFATYILDDPIVGKDFFGTGQHIRDAENANLWCGNSCYGQVHADGEPLMGALWNVRQNLKSTYGVVAGGAAANTLFNTWMNAFDDGSVGPIIRDHWLVLDDDNGNINDGTPNFDDIDGGFVQQAFPAFQLSFVLYANVVEPGDTQSESGPYTVTADITPSFNPPVMGTMLNYRVNGGAFTQVPMSLVSGSTFTAGIPGQVSPAKVEWFIDATDGGANSTTLPAQAPAVLKSFEIGVKSTYFFDDFEAGIGGWTHGLITNQDDWQRSSDEGAANGSFGKAGDATSAFSGTEIWGNDLGPSGWNGLYQDNTNNWLRSPSIDLSAATGSRLRFQRWLTVEDGAFDQARVRVNGTQVWVNPNGANLIDSSWVAMDIDISAFDGNSSVTVEFSIQTDGGVNFGGWNIDDVEIASLVASPSTGVTYCTSGTSFSGCQGQIGASGSPSASASSGFSLTASTVQGNVDGLFFYGTNGRQANTWGNGTSFQCVTPPVVRAGILTGAGTSGLCDGAFAQDINALWTAKPAKNPGAGALVQAQFWYRDPNNTSNQTTSLSNAVEFSVAP